MKFHFRPDVTSLGEGILDWEREERISSRFGFIHLCAPESSPESPRKISFSKDLRGRHGKLIAFVRTPVESWTHVATVVPGVPGVKIPRLGARIVLGEGILFFEGDEVGLCPDDGRAEGWLKHNALMRAHNQCVALYFEETPLPRQAD